MKETTTRRSIALVLVLAMILSTLVVTVNPMEVEAASKITSLSVKTKSTSNIREGQVLTKAMVKSAVKVTIKRANGKKTSGYTGYTCTQVGKTVKPISSGTNKNKFKLTIKAGSKKKSVYVKVNKLTKISSVTTTLKLNEGATFNEKTFRSKTTVKGAYKSGSAKALTTYTVSAAKTVTRNSSGYFVVTVKYGSFSKKVNVSVTPKPVTQYKITVAVNGDGTATINGVDSSVQTVNSGSTVKLVATPKTGNKFVAWKDVNGKTLSTDSTYSFKASADTVVIATFEEEAEPETVSITVNRTGAGIVSMNNTVINFSDNKYTSKVLKGSAVILSATNTSEYNFVKWTDGSKDLSTQTTYSFTASADTAITAVFEKVEAKNTVTVAISGNGLGTVKIDGESVRSKEVKVGTVVTVTAAPQNGSQFTKWTDLEGKTISTYSTYSFVVQKDIVLVGNFDKIAEEPDTKYTVTALVEGNGTVNSTSLYTTEVTKGTVVNLVATPSTGSQFVKWTDNNGTQKSTTATYAVTVTSNLVLVAHFELNPVENVNVTVNRTGAGQVSLNNTDVAFVSDSYTQSFTKGTQISLTATNTSQYKFVRWTNGSSSLSTNATYSFTANSNTNVTAVFERVYTVTVNMTGGKGKVTFAGESLDFYSNVATTQVVPGTYSVVAAGTDDYQFVSWNNSSGRVLSTANSYTVSVAGDTTLTVKFAEIDKTVKVTYQTSGENPTVFLSESVGYGETLTPPTNVYRSDSVFKGWKIGNTLYSGERTASEFYNGTDKLSDAIIALTTAKQNVTVVAYYEDPQDTYYTISVTGGELQDRNGNAIGSSVLANSIVQVVATAPYNAWQSGGTTVSTTGTYIFKVENDMTLVAVTITEPEPIVALRGSGYTISEADHAVSILTAIDLPDGYTNLEWGCLFSTQADEFDYTSAKVVQDTDPNVIYATYANSSVALTGAVLFTSHVKLRARVYAKVKDSLGETKTIYSDVVTIQL